MDDTADDTRCSSAAVERTGTAGRSTNAATTKRNRMPALRTSTGTHHKVSTNALVSRARVSQPCALSVKRKPVK